MSKATVAGSASAVDGPCQAGSSDVAFLVDLDQPAGQARFDPSFGLKEILDGWH